MSLFQVVQRVLNKAGNAFIEPRREDGHGSTELNPTHVTGDFNTQLPQEQFEELVPQKNALTNDQLRDSPVPVSLPLAQTFPLPDAQLAQLIPQTDVLTREQLDSAPVIVETGLIQPTTPLDVQPVSIETLPLPDGAATAEKQLPDNHQVMVSNQIVQPTTPDDTQPTSENQTLVFTETVVSNTPTRTPFVTPSVGKRIRITWYSLQASPENSATVVAGICFGLVGPNIHTWELSKYGAIIAHNFKAADCYVEGAVDEILYLDQDIAQIVRGNINYEEV